MVTENNCDGHCERSSTGTEAESESHTSGDDPRMWGEYVSTFAGSNDQGDITLVGVVHDHPSSVFRVGTIVDREQPDVLALELPSVAVPLYEQYARSQTSPPEYGGEFSRAVQAASTEDVVGIDGPSLGFLRDLVSRLVANRASPETLKRSLHSIASVTRTAVACRLAASVRAWTSRSLSVGSPVTHDISSADHPDAQVADEKRQIRAAVAVQNAFQGTRSSQCRAATREQYMVEQLSSARTRGNVVAIIGAGHFDPITDRLSAPHPSEV